MPLQVIVSGAGIAGLALAHWLHRIGAGCVLVEKAPRFQALGHYISLKGNGVEMVRCMGIFEACQARAVTADEVRFYTRSGRFLRSERTAALARTLGGYLLFRRADLQSALHELVRGHADIRFGRQIAEVRPIAGGVEVALDDGTTERADVLVGADGIHSRVRDLVFGQGYERPLGGHYIAVTQELRHDLPLTVRSYLGDGVMVNLFVVTRDAISAVIYTGGDAGRPPHHDPPAMRDYLLGVSAGFPDEARRVLDRVGAGDFVFSDVIAQIEMPTIVKGRSVLVGDAAHCPTFLSGMGSSLAMQDAHVLAGCLARSPGDVASALARYEGVMTPIARRYHDTARTAHRVFLTRGRARGAARDLALQVMPERFFELGVRRFFDAERPLADVPATG